MVEYYTELHLQRNRLMLKVKQKQCRYILVYFILIRKINNVVLSN